VTPLGRAAEAGQIRSHAAGVGEQLEPVIGVGGRIGVEQSLGLLQAIADVLAEALDLLKAWGTGHPGGIGTIHAGSAIGALRRMEQLIQEAVVTVPRALIAETIQVIAVLAGRGSDRCLDELACVEGLGPNGDYVLQSAGDQP